MGSSYKLWEKRLRENDTLTRGHIRQFCNAIGAGAEGYYIGGARTNLTHEECVTLVDLFYERSKEIPGGGFKLTEEHTQFGFEWLTTYPKRAMECGIEPYMLGTFEGFRFVDYKVASSNGWGRVSMVPIYRVLYRDVDETLYVDYGWSPWQTIAYG